MKPLIILENIRSAYNVGNVLRTADALGWNVWITGYTPSPWEQKKVVKTSLGAEDNVGLEQFLNAEEAIHKARELGYQILAAECDSRSVLLGDFSKNKKTNTTDAPCAVIFGNEVDGVLSDTLTKADTIVQIPMVGTKESLNVGQSTAIIMRELGNLK